MRRWLVCLSASLVVSCGSADEGPSAEPLPDSEIDAVVDAAGDSFEPAKDDASTDANPNEDVAIDGPKDALPDGTTPCRAELAEKGVSFKTTTARGVADAIHLLGPINGVLFASGTDTKPMGDPVACEFARTLHRFADLLKSKGFVRVGTLGSYCYRCCCAWSPTNFCRDVDDPEPSCGASGYSNHSFGRAVDVRYLYKADGTRYDINDPKHWVKYPTTETCTKGLAAQTGISRELYVVACEATALKIFGTVLTPNYNDAHRNHFHMDIGQSGTPSVYTTKSWNPWAGVDDAPPGADQCGP